MPASICFFTLFQVSALVAQIAAPSHPAPGATDSVKQVADTVVFSDRFPSTWYPPADHVTGTESIPAGAPYSATLVTRGARAASGAEPSATYETRSKQMRDSRGRMRSESIPTPDGHGGMLYEVTVDDPVSHCHFNWSEPLPDSMSKDASVTCMAQTVYRTPDSMSEAKLTAPKHEEKYGLNQTATVEPLGEKSIAGVRAFGQRSVRPPAAPGAGPITAEIWWSPELKETVLLKTSNGKEDMSLGLEDIHQVEQRPEKFYPPAGYKIVPYGQR